MATFQSQWKWVRSPGKESAFNIKLWLESHWTNSTQSMHRSLPKHDMCITVALKWTMGHGHKAPQTFSWTVVRYSTVALAEIGGQPPEGQDRLTPADAKLRGSGSDVSGIISAGRQTTREMSPKEGWISDWGEGQKIYPVTIQTKLLKFHSRAWSRQSNRQWGLSRYSVGW